MNNKPKMAFICTGIRRDLISPIRYFKRIEVVPFYQNIPYSDFDPKEFNGDLVHYRSIFDLCYKIRKYKPDIIQGSEPYGFPITSQACGASYLMSKFLNVPMVFPMLENRPPEIKFRFIGSFLKAHLRFYANSAKTIFYLNDGAKRNLLSAGVEPNKLKRLMWGCWGVDIDEFAPRKNGSEPSFGRSILFVGRLSEDKGIHYLLRAFEKVREVLDDVKLIIIGKGRHIKPEKDIIVLGTVKNKDLPPYFRAVDLTITPSITTSKWEEQIGMVNLQSMACGTPVVSTYSGAIPEYVKHNETGILVPERDVDSLASVIIILLTEDKIRKRLGRNARKYTVENFDAKKNIEANEKIVLELLKGDR